MASICSPRRQLAPTVGPAAALAGVSTRTGLSSSTPANSWGRVPLFGSRDGFTDLFIIDASAAFSPSPVRPEGLTSTWRPRAHTFFVTGAVPEPGDCGVRAVSPAQTGGSTSTLSPLSGPVSTASVRIWRALHACTPTSSSVTFRLRSRAAHAVRWRIRGPRIHTAPSAPASAPVAGSTRASHPAGELVG